MACQLFPTIVTRIGHLVQEERDVITELPEQECLVDAADARAENTDALPAHFPPVTVGAMQYALSPEFPDAGQVGDLVGQSRREQESARPNSSAASEIHLEPVVTSAGGDGAVVQDVRSVVRRLSPPGREEFERRGSVPREYVVHTGSGSIARVASTTTSS